jgi:hypothetical protein
MKRIYLLGLLLLMSTISNSQNNLINYKALIQDGSGNTLVSEVVNIRFTIFLDAVQVYQETHSTTTDANGIAIVNIGGGSTTDNFTTIDWNGGVASLRTEIDSGSGFVDIGTTQFRAVPYALNVSGLEAIDEGNGRGWRLIRNFTGNYGAIGSGAIDLSSTSQTGLGATGTGAFAIGLDNLASGEDSFAGGFDSQSTGNRSFAFGNNAIASTNNSVAFGDESRADGIGAFAAGLLSQASGSYAVAFNRDTFAAGDYSAAFNNARSNGQESTAFNNATSGSYRSFAIGDNNIGGGNSNLWLPTDPLFEIGNGNGGVASNALTILKNGTVIAPSLTNTLINTAGDKALVTKEYVDQMGSGSLVQVTEGANTGWRMETNPTLDGGFIIPIGDRAVDLAIHDDGVWDGTGASGQYSFAANYDNKVEGIAASGFGNNSLVSGNASFAAGTFLEVSGSNSAAFGLSSFVGGEASYALGTSLTVTSNNSVAVGRFNEDTTNAIFMIGNGASSVSRANALTVLNDGTLIAPSLTNSLINNAGDKALVTKEYVDQIGSGSLVQVTEGANTGWRMETSPTLDGGFIIPIGDRAVDLAIHDDGVWDGTGASGQYSFAANYDNKVEGIAASVFGNNSYVSGNASFAAGTFLEVSGNNSAAFGISSFAGGEASYALGSNLLVTSNNSLAIGSFNEDIPNALFMVGNGASSASRANALTVTNTGKTTVFESTNSFGEHAINGIKNHIGQTDAAGVYGENTVSDWYGYGVFGRAGYQGVRGEVNGTGSFSYFGLNGFSGGVNSGTNYGVYGFATGGATNYAVYAAGDLAHTGAIINASDRKLKTNINSVSNALESIRQLNPTTYSIKEEYVEKMNMSKTPQIGFIAQELQEIFPNLVSENKHPGKTKNDSSIDYLGVNYIGLIPILTAGIKEQQEIIEQQQQQIRAQEVLLQDLLRRIEALENRD